MAKESEIGMVKQQPASIKIGDLAFDLAESGLTASGRLELGLGLDPSKTLIVSDNTEASGVSGMVDSTGLSYILVRDHTNEITGLVDVGWAVQQARTHLKLPISSFGGLVDAVDLASSPSGKVQYDWLTTANYGRPPLIWCDRHRHLAARNPCGEP
jgi:hypothetical protein